MKLPWPQKQTQDQDVDQAKPDSQEAVIVEVIRSAEAHIERLLLVRQEHPIDAADILSPVTADTGAKNLVGFQQQK